MDYKQGFIDGLRAFAWWKDGVEYIGTSGTTLREAIEKIEEIWTWNPPKSTLKDKMETFPR